MTAVPEGPCAPWCTWDDVLALPGGCAAAETIGDNDTLQDQILASATRTLWLRTCEQFGECTITRARIAPVCRHAYSWRPGYGYSWRGFRGGSCGCRGGHYLPLGDAPVVSVTTVWQDGVELDPSAYRVDDWDRIVRVDGESWHNGAGIDAAQGATSTNEATWIYGVPVPLEGGLYAAMLACKKAGQVVEQCGGSPSNAVNISREGETIILEPTADSTGIAIVEEWLSGFHCGEGRMFDPAGDRAVVRRGT